MLLTNNLFLFFMCRWKINGNYFSTWSTALSHNLLVVLLSCSSKYLLSFSVKCRGMEGMRKAFISSLLLSQGQWNMPGDLDAFKYSQRPFFLARVNLTWVLHHSQHEKQTPKQRVIYLGSAHQETGVMYLIICYRVYLS